MRKTLLVIALLSSCLAVSAQTFNMSNSLSRVAMVYYSKDANGLYQKKENVILQEVSGVVSIYGYNKKAHELYVATANANCIVLLNDDSHKSFKKDKSIPQLKPEELTEQAEAVNKRLAEEFMRLNNARQKYMADSIAQVKKAIQQREAAMRKAREDSLRLVAERNKEESYRNSHRWFIIPSKKNKVYCEFCEKSIDTNDSLFCLSIKNDTLYWVGHETGKLDIDISHIHAGKIPKSLLADNDLKLHRKIFNDSLSSKIKIDKEMAAYMNRDYYGEYLSALKKAAPNGLFLSWGWDNDYSNIEFHFEYLNTNVKTIKYIEVFFVVTNAVNDVRKSGSFKGTGPLEEWHSATWSWDHSPYYVAGDASEMAITKVIITYMNGTKVTIPKNKLRFD